MVYSLRQSLKIGAARRVKSQVVVTGGVLMVDKKFNSLRFVAAKAFPDGLFCSDSPPLLCVVKSIDRH